MPKQPKKNQAIPKGKFDIKEFKKNKGLDKTTSDKELTWLPLSEAFNEAVSLPGFPRGYVSLIRGFSDTGKSTAIYELIKACQRSKYKDLPVIIDTETNFNWEHAKSIGIEFEEQADEETGEVDYDGDFIYVDAEDLLQMYKYFDYKEGKEKTKPQRNQPVIEDVAHFMSDMLDAQDEGELPRNLCFVWDSIGSLDCYESVISKTPNNMWNAGALNRQFNSILNHRIPSSRKETKEYTNTFAAVQKIWVDNTNPQPVVKHKGGEAFWHGARLIIHMGGITSRSTQILKAVSDNRTYQFGVQTKINVNKNHINGTTLQGRIASTPHGFVNPDKIDEYKKNYRDYLQEKMEIDSSKDLEIEAEEEDFSNEDVTE